MNTIDSAPKDGTLIVLISTDLIEARATCWSLTDKRWVNWPFMRPPSHWIDFPKVMVRAESRFDEYGNYGENNGPV